LPIRFWGLGYDAAIKNSRSEYSRRAFAGSVKFLNRIVGDFYGGASLDLRYNKASSIDELARLYISQHGMTQQNAFTTGLGLNLLFDHRDNIYATNSGWFVSLLTEIRPKGLGDCGSTLWHVKAIADYFTPIWQGGVLGVDLYADLWSSATPWFMWPCIGGGSRMRGYYFGRYTDRKMITAQLELRQAVWGPFGICVWGGAGTIFDKCKEFDASKILPNGGLGVRVAAGDRTALRVDYGFGRKSHGLIINIQTIFLKKIATF
jgi:outer membrane protein assembly factor BamA